ncbi:MAG: hypothetical protein AB1758_05930 [Candidatus Eremiobacterota bacterium]
MRCQVGALAVILGVTWWAGSPAARSSQSEFTSCKSNLKNIGTACALYATDYPGYYPASLSVLIPNYLRSIPACPTSGRSYLRSYRLLPGGFRVCCTGRFHAEAGGNDYPAYDSLYGVAERPTRLSADRQKVLECQWNMAALFLAVERYRQRHDWTFPEQLSDAMSPVPTCPAAGKATYASESTAAGWTITCQGHHHAAAGCRANEPGLRVLRGDPGYEEPFPNVLR